MGPGVPVNPDNLHEAPPVALKITMKENPAGACEKQQ